ncbi:MAG TPA: STAS domain-containing protein [Clostridia bacterium]|nr:STAS domain-containing protein [Clostridia bacterium]
MLQFERRQNQLLVRLAGELTFFNSTETKEKIKEQIRGDEERLILDVSGLEMIDSSGVGVIISLLKKLDGKDLILVAPQPKIARVFEITRINQIVPILPSLDHLNRL